MSDTTNYTDEQKIVDQKAIELAEDFSYDGYQVVRREIVCTFKGACCCDPERQRNI